jgi:AbrB family looped-hinge helix DNA binding protein
VIAAHGRIKDGGRLVIPAALRKRLGLKVGDEVVLELSDDELRIRSLSSAIRQAQKAVRSYVQQNARLSDELVTERRREAAHD